MLLETCRYKVVDGKVITKMFGMGSGGWDIDPGWHHSPKDAKAAVEIWTPVVIEPTKKIDGRTKAGKKLKAQQNGNSSRSD